MDNKELEFKEYLKTHNCRGCYNYCSLASPICGRSKIFIEEAIEKFKNKEEN